MNQHSSILKYVKQPLANILFVYCFMFNVVDVSVSEEYSGRLLILYQGIRSA